MKVVPFLLVCVYKIKIIPIYALTRTDAKKVRCYMIINLYIVLIFLAKRGKNSGNQASFISVEDAHVIIS
jgi:hypothetical protein